LTGTASDSGDVVGGFLVEELVSALGDVELHRARDEQVDRRVLLRIAGAASADSLLEDARRIASVSHPGLVAVLGAGRSEKGAYAAIQELDARPFREAGGLSSAEAARVAIDIAGAIGALSQAGLRAPIDAGTVLVSRTHEGVRGLLDPFRALAPGRSCLSDADAGASTAELANLLDEAVAEPSEGFRRAFGGVLSGVTSTPDELVAALAPVVAPLRPTAWRRSLVLVALACLAAAAVVIAVVARGRSGGSPPPAPVAAPAARIIARIPLGLTGQAVAFSPVVLGHAIWLATSDGGILHVDATTNQIVGNRIKLPGRHPLSAFVASGGALFATDYAGWLFRIDPASGRVTGKRRLGTSLPFITAAAGVLWIASDTGTKGALLRIDPHTLRPVATPVDIIKAPFHLEVRGRRVWVLGGRETGEVERVDTSSGRRAVVHAGPQMTTAALAGGTLWVTDRYDGTVTPLNAERMAFDREAVQAPRSARGALTLGGDLWITSSSALTSGGNLRLERIDPRSGRRSGRGVVLGKTIDFGAVAGFHSLWIVTAKSLIRLAPATPRPALAPSAPSGTSPRVFRAGPLAAATWRTAVFAAPLTFSTPAFAWIALYPQADSLSVLSTRRRFAELDLTLPRQVFATDATVRDVHDAARALKAFQANPHLQVGAVHRVVIGGRPALQFEVRARDPAQHPEVCGPTPCTFLFPAKDATFAVSKGDVARISLLTSAARVVLVIEGGDGDDKVALSETAALLRTFHFAR
jgi:hypothetical protein